MDRQKLNKAIAAAFKSYFGGARPHVDAEVFARFVAEAYAEPEPRDPVEALVEEYEFGAWADRAEAFAALSPRMPVSAHERLRQLIDAAATKHDGSLE